jgi:ABC-type Na+ efflux pump permease subunit
MKKLLPFAGFCATVLGIIALILVMATNSVGYPLTSSSTSWYSGIQGIFGGKVDLIVTIGEPYKGTAGAIIAFILLIVGIILACAASLAYRFLRRWLTLRAGSA